jgi:hypothetical protein
MSGGSIDKADAQSSASAGLVVVGGARDVARAEGWFHHEFWVPRVGLRDRVVKMRNAESDLRAQASSLAASGHYARSASLLNAADELDSEAGAMMTLDGVDGHHNVVCTLGKNKLLDEGFAGSAYTAAWYMGLISSVSYSAVAAADTMSSHAGWTEAGPTNAPNYSSGTRPAATFGSAASAGSKSTSAASSFVFSGSGTVKGPFITTNSTKDGTTGILYSAGTFTGGDRAVLSGDTINSSWTGSL